MKILLVTFSDHADHQDTVFGLYEALRGVADAYLLAISSPKVPLDRSDRTWLVDCPKRPGLCWQTFNLPLLFKIIRRIRRERFDAIYFESLHVWNLPVLMLAGSRCRTFQVIHDVVPHEGDRQTALVNCMNRAVCRLADGIVLRSQRYRALLMDRYHVAPSRVTCLELWRRYPAYTEPTHSGTVLFFGRINPYKGAENLLTIAQRCVHIRFEVIGRVNPQMEKTAERLKHLPNVHLRDAYVSDEEMKDAFMRADWVILPYRSASQSGVIVDAYKYARPVIAFDVGAISEQVADGYSGYLVEAGNIEAFVQRLNMAASLSPQAHARMCQNAYAYGASKYAVDGAVGRFLHAIALRSKSEA